MRSRAAGLSTLSVAHDELELLDRERRATERRIRQAKFPVVKTLDSLDFMAMPWVNKTLVLELARCDFLARRENVLLLTTAARGKPISPWLWAWLHASGATACALPLPLHS